MQFIITKNLTFIGENLEFGPQIILHVWNYPIGKQSKLIEHKLDLGHIWNGKNRRGERKTSDGNHSSLPSIC